MENWFNNQILKQKKKKKKVREHITPPGWKLYFSPVSFKHSQRLHNNSFWCHLTFFTAIL